MALIHPRLVGLVGLRVPRDTVQESSEKSFDGDRDGDGVTRPFDEMIDLTAEIPIMVKTNLGYRFRLPYCAAVSIVYTAVCLTTLIWQWIALE